MMMLIPEFQFTSSKLLSERTFCSHSFSGSAGLAALKTRQLRDATSATHNPGFPGKYTLNVGAGCAGAPSTAAAAPRPAAAAAAAAISLSSRSLSVECCSTASTAAGFCAGDLLVRDASCYIGHAAADDGVALHQTSVQCVEKDSTFPLSLFYFEIKIINRPL